LRRNAEYDIRYNIYHTVTDMYGCHEDSNFNFPARHIDDNQNKYTALRKGGARDRYAHLVAQCGLAPRSSAVPNVYAGSK
jgi:hypothetical protein